MPLSEAKLGIWEKTGSADTRALVAEVRALRARVKELEHKFSLEGYRELGAQTAAALNERDAALARRKHDIRQLLERVEKELRAFKAGQLTTGQDCADLVRKIRETET